MADIRTDFADNIGMTVNAAYLNGLGAAVNENAHTRPSSGTFAACPAAGTVGRVYFATDAGIILRDNGTTWDVIGGDGNATASVPSTGWTTTTLGSATVVADKGSRLMTLPQANAAPVIEYRTLTPTSGYTATCRIQAVVHSSSGQVYMGMFVRDSASGNALFWGRSTLPAYTYVHLDYSTPTGIQTTNYAYSNANGLIGMAPEWFRIRDNGTNRYFEYSYNGLDWATYASHARTTGVTPNQIGWGGANNNNPQPLTGRLRAWSVA